MQKNKKRLRKTNLFLSLLLLLPSLAFSQKLSVADYAFEKNVVIEESSESLEIPLDAESLKYIDERFGNFNVFDENNENVEFSAFYQNPHTIKNVSLIDVSSQREGSPQAIVDENFTTSFLFSEKEDRQGASWFIVDLGRVQPLNRVEVFVTEASRIKNVEIEGGETISDLETIYDKKAFERSIELSTSPQARYLKISLWGLRIDITDLRITSSREGIIYLGKVGASQRIKFLYGGNIADHIKYKERYSSPSTADSTGKLTKQKWNSAFPSDSDDDGKDNKEDNCPFEKNSLQFDKDGDGFGDACDNAPKVRNINQNDTDSDGVGDIIDNCKLHKNTDQSDRDGDGFGDACDNAHAGSAVSGKRMFMYVFGLILLALVLKSIWTLSSKNKNS